MGRAGLVALVLVVGTAGSRLYVGDLEAPKYPPKSVVGNWTGELYGVRFKLTVTESGTPYAFFNSTTVGGSGWLV